MIKIIDGDLLNATEDIICHQVNCQGVMGSGVARQVKEKYPEVFESYKKACKEISCLLGGVLYVSIKNKQQSIANLFAQDSYGKQGLYTDYIALQSCLNDLKHTTTGSIAFPYLMSCCRGGGDWVKVEGMILDILGDRDVTIYRYKKGENDERYCN